ncbi:MAG TPA: winged helix-turn-helix domain-containing protein, partial [Bryobacteraceae bacterium]|nr:winged helix-turn-helix domain-containing protein [Bryobacteraceae bacterium]
FGVFELDLRTGELRKHGVRIKLQEQPFKVLAMLVERPGEVVTREEIQKRLWGSETTIDFEASLGRAVNKIRDALGDTPENPRFVETLTRRGYRFIAPVIGAEAPTAARPLPVVPAVPVAAKAPSRRKLAAALALVPLVALAGAAWWLFRATPPPRVVRSVQVTDSGRIYPGDVLLQCFPTFVTDGSRLYYPEIHAGRVSLANVAAGGGTSRPIAAPAEIPGPSITDISADGSQLLIRNYFSPQLEQPLWAAPSLGGAARKVGSLLAHDATWSPDQRSIVYAAGADLMVAHADGSASRKLVTAPGRAYWLRWSPDGSRLRFTIVDSQTHATSLWEVSANGRNLHLLFPKWNEPPAECCGNWTPDGKYYAFQSTREGATDIWVTAERHPPLRRAADPVRLTAGPLNFLAPVPSRDGKRLFVVGAQSRGELLIYDPARQQFSPYVSDAGAASSLAFSRDGQWIVYVAQPSSLLWRSRVDGTQKVQLTSAPMQVYMARWSPDGSRLVVMARTPGKPWKLYLVPSEGGNLRELGSEDRNAADPAWSPDGNRIAYGRLPEYMAETAQPKAIHILDLKSNTATLVPQSEGLFAPRWSPDGRYIAALPLTQDRLAVYDVERGTWTNLVSSSTDNPTWSRDGKWIYFYAFGQEGRHIYRVRVADRKVERVASFQDVRRADVLDYAFLGLSPDEQPIVRARVSTADIYALEWEAQ